MESLLHDFSVGLFIWQSLIFIVLIFLLKKFAWKPILSSVEDREEGIKQALVEAKAAKEEMANLKASNEELLKEARIEREAMLKEARDARDTIVNGATKEAKIQAETLINNAKVAIQSEKEKAMTDIKNEVAVLAIEVAGKLLKENLSSDAKQKDLAEKYVKDLNLN